MASKDVSWLPTASSLRVGGTPNAEIQSLRERFLTEPGATDLSSLRPVIARSWQRSLACNVTATSPFLQAAVHQADEQLLAAAEPVLTELERLCSDSGGLVVLTDAEGTLAVFRGDATERRKAELLFPSLGAQMAEDLIGTNSDGTVLEEGEAVQVWGAEHFNEALQNSYCTSAPIRDPIRRSVRGVLGLMLPEKLARNTDPGSVLLTVHGAAADITRRLAERLAAREQALMSEYLKEIRKRGADAVVAMDERTTIASRSALRMLDPSDFAVLAALAREAEQRDGLSQHRLNVSTGREVQLHIRPMDFRESGSGGASVMRVQVPSVSLGVRAAPTAREPQAQFDGMVGTSRAFKRALGAAAAAVSRRMPAHIIGEQGSGKRTLAEAMAGRLSRETRVFDFTQRPARATVDDVDAALEQGAAVILHRADKCPPHFLDDLGGLLHVLEQPQLILTAGAVGDDLLPVLSALRGIEVAMPPLRDRREDIVGLASHLLRRAVGREVRMSPKLRDALVAADWPGNVRQLRDLVESAASRSLSGELHLSDLNAVQLRGLGTMPLTRLEEAELQQIRAALAEASGNRVRAASLLGIGRSTLYRKIESYEAKGFDLALG
ncbi:transcriptional regulator of acetoin/glycerol metabolism [Arthrobacter sp. 1088]|uniref:sigma-54-dependent Fis family transcriptional regulator n=1 Tax=unclassified Arthrobacter TaxID=235627 RepID=UPI001CC81F0B|nr:MULTISPECIES: helix-turn-helix domain-containing protein [unclassified Arthrobacter]MDR6685430.1 transcriptional regulator of acetoin/glycerol metabolism [Arthrobacter sp. 1088]BCW52363.1 Fis family transcriptional regulator [Arthrobacter sp. StoSoilB13]